MHIVVVHQYFLAGGTAGGSRFNELTRLWAEAGHEVTVVGAGFDYMTGQTPEKYRGRWVTEEYVGAVRVLRCYVPSSYYRSYGGRMWAFACFVACAVAVGPMIRDVDIVIATSPPLPAAVAGWCAARLRLGRVPWIFEVRDLWPEGAVTTGVLKEKSLLTKGLYLLERLACRSADAVNVLTPAFRDNLLKRGLVTEDKVYFVPNGADLESFVPTDRNNDFRREQGWGDKLVALYAGAHGRANALHQLVDAAEHLRSHDDVLLALVGGGPEKARLEQEAKRRGLSNITFVAAQAKERMPEVVNACDVGVAVLQRNPTFLTVYPNKVFDYMACERPVLLGIDGVARKLVVDEARAGVFATPEDAAAIAEALVGLKNDPEARATMGRNGRRWVAEHVDRRQLAKEYLRVMQEVATRSGGLARRARWS